MKTSKKSQKKKKPPKNRLLRRAMEPHLPPRMDTLWAPRAGPEPVGTLLTARSTSHPRADCCYARRVATPLQQLEGFKREVTIVSAELDDEAAVMISCPREGGGGPVQSRRRAPDDKYLPHSPTPLLTRPALLCDGRAR